MTFCDRAAGLQPWLENPFRLISWWDMNRFSADKFVNIGASLEWFGSLVETGEWSENMKATGERMGNHLAKDLREIGCEVAADAAIRFGLDLTIMKSITDVKPRARELKDTISSEMRRHLFFWVPPDRARFYQYPENVDKWNESERAIEGPIRDRFPKATIEINFARQCYALAMWTPCVFHLMRACELGIKALYKTLNQTSPSLSDSWGNMLKPLDRQLALPIPQRHGCWATNAGFFDHATNDVRAIKRVWRDSTMHIEANYDESGARKALDAVTSFFVHLSSELDENGKVYPSDADAGS
jgi:hypothetical protein